MAESPDASWPGMPAAKENRVGNIINDALLLLDYAIESGFKSEDGRAVPDDVIAPIQAVGGKFKSASHADDGSGISAGDWLNFELAYYRLTGLMSPVTAETLRNTEGTSRFALWDPSRHPTWKTRAHKIFLILFGFSPAQRFTRGLWLVAIFFAAFVVLSEWYLLLSAQVADQQKVLFWRSLVELLVPWAYGGLGSCVYLLKSAHVYIHQRTFDLRRKPEYFNRILLGTVSGGAIILFVNQITTDGGDTVRLSSAALGFLAGYSTEFLFSTIERVIAAILPKVGISTVATQRPALPPRQLDLAEIAALYGKAKTKEDRDFFRSMIEQVTKSQTP